MHLYCQDTFSTKHNVEEWEYARMHPTTGKDRLCINMLNEVLCVHLPFTYFSWGGGGGGGQGT